MSKYDKLWAWIRENGSDRFCLSYDEIEAHGGVPIDHSFLNSKKELSDYGFQVEKISMKEKKVFFSRK